MASIFNWGVISQEGKGRKRMGAVETKEWSGSQDGDEGGKQSLQMGERMRGE